MPWPRPSDPYGLYNTSMSSDPDLRHHADEHKRRLQLFTQWQQRQRASDVRELGRCREIRQLAAERQTNGAGRSRHDGDGELPIERQHGQRGLIAVTRGSNARLGLADRKRMV